MGWNYVKFIDGSEFSKLFDSEQRFYFVHSYHIPFSDSKDVLTTQIMMASLYLGS